MNASLARTTSKIGAGHVRAWVVRGGEQGETVGHNLDAGVATIGWDAWAAPDDARFEHRSAYGDYIDDEFSGLDASKRQSSRDQVWRFYHQVSVGDLVVLPLKNHGTADDWIAVRNLSGVSRFVRSEGARR